MQEGVDGSEEITYETTMIDGAVTDRQAVAYNVLQAPRRKSPSPVPSSKRHGRQRSALVPSSGLCRATKYVSRWMGNGHRGADICAAYHTTIIASDSGTVVAAGWHYSYGNYVEIDHGNGYRTLYGHMSKLPLPRAGPSARARPSAMSVPPATPPATTATLRCRITAHCSAPIRCSRYVIWLESAVENKHILYCFTKILQIGRTGLFNHRKMLYNHVKCVLLERCLTEG